MADEPAPASVPAVTTPASAQTGVDGGNGTKVPLHELLTERGKRQTAETELATVRPRVTELERTLAETQAAATAAQSKASEWEAYQATQRAKLVEALPEDHRPIAGELPLDKLEAYVGLHGQGAQRPPAAPLRPGQAPGDVALTPEQITAGVAKEGLAFLNRLGQ